MRQNKNNNKINTRIEVEKRNINTTQFTLKSNKDNKPIATMTAVVLIGTPRIQLFPWRGEEYPLWILTRYIVGYYGKTKNNPHKKPLRTTYIKNTIEQKYKSIGFITTEKATITQTNVMLYKYAPNLDTIVIPNTKPKQKDINNTHHIITTLEDKTQPNTIYYIGITMPKENINNIDKEIKGTYKIFKEKNGEINNTNGILTQGIITVKNKQILSININKFTKNIIKQLYMNNIITKENGLKHIRMIQI